jgi:hypothetical protein
MISKDWRFGKIVSTQFRISAETFHRQKLSTGWNKSKEAAKMYNDKRHTKDKTLFCVDGTRAVMNRFDHIIANAESSCLRNSDVLFSKCLMMDVVVKYKEPYTKDDTPFCRPGISSTLNREQIEKRRILLKEPRSTQCKNHSGNNTTTTTNKHVVRMRIKVLSASCLPLVSNFRLNTSDITKTACRETV